MEWFIQNRPDLTANVACMRTPGHAERRLLSIVSQDQLRSVLRLMLDENEFLSQYGIRAISRFHKDHPYTARSPTCNSTLLKFALLAFPKVPTYFRIKG